MRYRVLALVVLATVWPAAASAEDSNPVAAENALQGTTRWDLGPPPARVIEGYASQASVAPGDSFDLHVSAPAADSYRVLVYRLGWYGGDGGRLVACLPGCDSEEPAVAQPAAPEPDPFTGAVDAGWRVTDVLPVGSDWVSGYYLAVLRVTSGPDTGAYGRIPLVVRAAPGDHAAILVQVPVNTWQAYNPWGGKSLYDFNSTDLKPAVKVSFDRPYAEGVPVSVPFLLELPAVRFLEREGYDVSYATDVDVDRTPDLLLRHRAVVSIGHDEYWSVRMRDAWDRAIHHGTNLGVLGANAGYWNVRYESSHRTLVEYRSAGADPDKSRASHTIQFRALWPRRRECRIFGGDEYEYYAQRAANASPTAYTVAARGSDPWLAGTGLEAGDNLPGLVGYEWDGFQLGCFPGASTVLLTALERGADGKLHHAQAVRGVARSGARVFASGSLEYAWGLDDYGGHVASAAIQQLTRNVLADLTTPASPRAVLARAGHAGVGVRVTLRAPDPRVRRILVYRDEGGAKLEPGDPGSTLLCSGTLPRCRDGGARGRVRYAAVATDRWGRSQPTWSRVIKARHG